MTSEEESTNEESACSLEEEEEEEEGEREESIFTLSTEFPARHREVKGQDDAAGQTERSPHILTREPRQEEVDYFEEGGGEAVKSKWGSKSYSLGVAAVSRRAWGGADEKEDSYDSPSPPGLPGTTPPTGSRFMKSARRTHKYKSGKKLSLGHIPKLRYRDGFKKRPCSMITLCAAATKEGEDREGEERDGHERRNTVHDISVRRVRRDGRARRVAEVKGGRRRHGGTTGSSGGGFHSPHHSGGDGKSLQKKKKKKSQRKITQDRDDKKAEGAPSPVPAPSSPSTQSKRSRPPLVPVQSVDIPDYTPSLYTPSLYNMSPESPRDYLTSSLQPSFLQLPSRSVSAGHTGEMEPQGAGRIYRSYSDAHVSLPPGMFGTSDKSRQQQPSVRCLPERKQFFRNFQKALKYSGIGRPQPQPVDTPFGGHPHMSRYYSENLGLENPHGAAMNDLWNELQAHLHNRLPEEQTQWLHYNLERIGKVLLQVVHFQILPIDPQLSLNQMFQPAPDYQQHHHGNSHRDGYEPVGEGEGEGKEASADGPDKCSTDSSTVMGEGGGGEEGEGSSSEVTTSLPSQPCSVDSTDDGPTVNKASYSPQEFLSPSQIIAKGKVVVVLGELERIESLYPNRQKIGDAHPQYRTLSFRRKVEALTLWLKVTQGLAKTLSTMSSWLGVSVILPEMCRESQPCSRSISNESKTVTFADQYEGRGEGGAGGGSKVFSVGSPKDDDPQQSLTHFSIQPLASRGQSSTGSSRPRGTLQRMFSSYQSVSLEGAMKGPYRGFVDRGLKKKSLSSLMESLLKFIDPIQMLAIAALTPSQSVEEPDDATLEPERRPLLRAFMAPVSIEMDSYHPRQLAYERTTSVSTLNWAQEFESMNLPHFGRQFIQLVHTPLDVMHECLKLQLELQLPEKPSPLSVKQLVHECRDTLKEAIGVRKKYREVMEVVTRDDHTLEQVEVDMEFFETDLNKVLMIYFNYLQSWVQVSSGHVLEEEWRHVKLICSHIRTGEAEAGRRFCDMAAHLLDSTGDMLELRMDDYCHRLHDMEGTPEECKIISVESCRKFKELFVEVRERASKAIGFAKMLRKDLEIAADFAIRVSVSELMDVLKASDHTRVILHNHTGKMIFVPEHMTDSLEDIQQLLSVSFTHSESTLDLKDSYLLLVAMEIGEGEDVWTGKTVEMKTSAETTISISEIQVECLKMVVASSTHLASSRTSFLNAVGGAVTLTNAQTSSHENVATRINDLKHAACKLGDQLIRAANQVAENLGMEDTSRGDDKTYQAAMHACFNLGFEYIRDMFRLVGEELAYSELGSAVLEYAQLWMRFVLEKCDRGRGTRPRWASTGLDFLTLACAPRQLALISTTNFESLKKLMNRSLDHVVGEAPPIQGYDTKFLQSPRPLRQQPHKRRQPPLLSAVSLPQNLSGKMENVVEEEWEGEAPLESTPARGGCTKAGLRVTFQSDSHSNDMVSPGMELGLPEVGVASSPPVSTESVSSGHDSPPVSHGDVCIPSMSFISPHTPPRPIPSPHLHTPLTLDREESNTSTASANSLYGSPYFSRSPSVGSNSSGNESGGSGDRVASIQRKIKVFELNREERLRKLRMIGRVKSTQPLAHPVRLSSLCQTHFKWQRGRKLGEGRFGKVYECRNLDTGEMMAVKQMSVQEKDTGTLQTICDEIGIFQRVNHENIVKFLGLEVHHMELYIFMEYCHEGTLWTIAQQGLPEDMIRRYTRDLLRAVDMLHDKGIIHRDIKGANIFLSHDSIKLGDFGLSVQLKNLNKTMPNEIRQQVGTVPYLSPEVVLKQEMGRPLDIWSVGCVVVEMATGKLPWSEYDHQFQIMFQIGTGKSPTVSSSVLCEEGHHFLSHCFQSNPNERWRASQLLSHPFVKVADD